jgi:hypothetical protein
LSVANYKSVLNFGAFLDFDAMPGCTHPRRFRPFDRHRRPPYETETVHQAWQREAFTDALRPVIVGITFITEADQHGRALLVLMHRFGAQIIAKYARIVRDCSADRNGTCWGGCYDAKLVRQTDRLLSRASAYGAAFPPPAELICRISAGQRLTA